MRKYKVYFEIYNKKLLVTVHANNEQEAKNIIKDKIQFNKVELCEDEFNDVMNMFDDIFKIIKVNHK